MSFPKSYTGLSLQPSSKHVIELLKHIEKNNGVLVHSSGHGKEEGTELKGTLTYRTGLNSGIMIALNKTLPSVYIKQYLQNGDDIFNVLPHLKTYLYDKYTFSKRGESAKGYNTHLDKFDWLNPSEKNPSILLKKIDIAHAKQIIDLHIKHDGVMGLAIPSENKVNLSFSTSNKSGKEMSPEELLKKLERQDAIGIKGEDFAIAYEKERLEGLGAKPEDFEKYIIDRRNINVSQGYDIESQFNGQSRYIEVKTTTVNAEADFFFSTNEFNVLKAKGEEAFIYRVVLSEDLESIVEIREIQNPFGDKETSDFKVIAFKASLKDFA